MTINDYKELAMRTNDGQCTERVTNKCVDFLGYPHDATDPGELLNGALGLTGEAGEVADLIKKFTFHGHDLDRDELVKELGDVCWYVALLCNAINVPLEEVMCNNIDKLKRRYPGGFSETASINRTE